MTTDTYSASYTASYGGVAVGLALYVFTPPTLNRVPPVLPDSRGPQRGLWRHYAPTPQGLNLYKYADGTYVLDQTPPHTTAELASDVAPVITYLGAHIYSVDAAEAAALTAAGYGSGLSEIIVPAPPTTGGGHPSTGLYPSTGLFPSSAGSGLFPSSSYPSSSLYPVGA